MRKNSLCFNFANDSFAYPLLFCYYTLHFSLPKTWELIHVVRKKEAPSKNRKAQAKKAKQNEPTQIKVAILGQKITIFDPLFL